VASPDSPVTYSVTGTDQNGCTGTDAISLDFFTVAAGTDTAICAEQAVQVFVSGSGTFQWSPTDGVSDPTSPSPFITPNGNSIYMVEVTSPFGCLARDSVQLTVLTLPVAAFTAQFQPTCDGVQAFFSNESADSGYYQWLFGDGTGSTTAEPQHIYPIGSGPVVTLIAFDGDSLCSDTVTVDFSGQWIGSDTIEVVFGNVITPNNDAHNDCFMPGFVGDMSNCYQLIVYNRWGGLIFESEVGSGHCWDGRTKAGRMVEDGTYYYIVRVADIEKAGWVLVASH
jgi:gliding motility-associated-like protein